MAEAADASTGSGAGALLAKLVNWGVDKKRPKTIKEADDLIQPVIKRWTWVAVSVSWVPGSTLVLTGVDYKIFLDIAKVYQIPDFNVDAMVVAIGGAVAGRGTAEVIGWSFGVAPVTNPIVAGVITRKLANAIMNYMRKESPLPKT